MESIGSTNNNVKSVESSNQGKKSLFGGPSEEKIFTLAHSLRCFSDLIAHLLVKKNLSMCLQYELTMTYLEAI